MTIKLSHFASQTFWLKMSEKAIWSTNS